MKKRMYILILTFTMMFGLISTTDGFAVSAGLSGGGTYTKGQTFTMTLSYTGGTFGAAQGILSYDKNVLELKSASGTFNNATGEFVVDAAGSQSLSMTFTFQAKAAGSTAVSVNTVKGGTLDKVEFYNGASATVTVKEPASSGGGSSSTSGGSSSTSGGSSGSNKKPSSNTNGRGDFTDTSLGTPDDPQSEEEAVDPSEKPDQIQITIGDKTYIIVEDLSEKKMPEGFTATDSKYGEYEWKIQVAKSDESKYTLILLKDSETDEESWFFYDEETGQVTSSTSLDVMGTLEYERLLLESEGQADNNINTYLIVLSCILGAAVIGLGGYLIYTKRGKLRRHDDDWE